MAIDNKIYIGSLTEPDYLFGNDEIFSASIVQKVALVGQELSIDSFTATVADKAENVMSADLFRSADGQIIETADGETYAIDVSDDMTVSDLVYLPHGTPVWYFQNNTLVGKFYVETVKRVGKNRYELNMVSAIGILDSVYHGGGLFTSSTFGTVLAHILASGLHGTGDPIIPYVIDENVEALPCTCWLPYDTKRNNLYQLVFANGVNIVKNLSDVEEYNGCPRFTFLYTTPSQAVEIDREVIYDEGDVEYQKPYTKISVLEHTYTAVQGAEPEVLFDNSVGEAADNKEIWFTNAPIIVSTLDAQDGLSIVTGTENVNSVKVTGNGKLYGVPYLHTTKTLISGDASADEKKTISVTDCTCVNLINSENLKNRLEAFYCRDNFIEKISNGIVYSDLTVDGITYPGGQRCGKAYKFRNPFNENQTAFLTSMNITVSAEVNKADCEWYSSYEPAGQQGLYKHVIILDKDTYAEDGGTFTVPDGVSEIKVVLIGGGTGGSSGWPGENGQDAYTHVDVESTADLSAVWYGAEGGDGGKGGEGGLPGRVKDVVIESPAASYSYTIGDGGEGGAHTGFIPDTADELREALENEHPDTEYTAQEIAAMIATEQSLSGWSGSPNPGSDGTASTFGNYSTADQDAYVPTGGVYEQLNDEYYALKGHAGIRGGKGGARKVKSGDTFNWVTDGEDVTGDDGMVYRGGSTGRMLTDVAGLPEATGKLKAYGGNGAGAAVGIGRDRVSPQTGLLLHPHINGGSDQETDWYIVEDE